MSAAVTTLPRAGATQEDLITILGNSLYPGAKPESIALVMAYCQANGLDPFLKPVHIVPTSVKMPTGRYEMRDVLMPGISDYRIKAARSGEYGGKSEPEFGPDKTQTIDNVQVTYPLWCRVSITRIVQGQPRVFTATERWIENYATAGRDTEAPNKMWRKRPYGQLAKCAESQALRMAFPEFSAGYTAEEMEGKAFEGMTLDAEAPHGPDQPRASGPARPPAPTEPKRTWRTLIDEIAGTIKAADTEDAVVAIADLPAVKRALAGPNAVQVEVKALLADAFERVRAIEDDAAEAEEPFPGDIPLTEPEVAVPG